jgi:16S rRNA (guanine527-N7)-methyltransferase
LVSSAHDIPVPSNDLLAGLIAGEGLSVPPGAEELLIVHAREVLRWNRSIRLTAITDPNEVAIKHILDSLLLLTFSPFPGRILDFGSGAGYPGIPLAIALPGSRVVLLESSGKKCSFLAHARQRLSLANVDIVSGRLTARSSLVLGRFEHIVTRATLKAEDALPLLLPYLAPGGRLLLMTGPGEGRKRGRRPKAEGSLSRRIFSDRTVGFELPFTMGFRQIREIRAL